MDQFNDKNRDEFVFLLSSKAGGGGLNLIGGNRLILFDPDWTVRTEERTARWVVVVLGVCAHNLPLCCALLVVLASICHR